MKKLSNTEAELKRCSYKKRVSDIMSLWAIMRLKANQKLLLQQYKSKE